MRLGRGRRRRSLDLQDSSESVIDGEAIGDAMKLCPSRKRPTYGGLNSEKHGAWEARTKSRRAPMLRASHAYRADSVCGGCNRRANPAPTAPGYEGFWNCKHIASCGSLVVIYQLCRLRSPRVHRIHSIPLVKHTYVTATLRGAEWGCSIYRSGRAPQQARGGGELVRRVPSVVMTRKDYIAQPARLITADMRSLTALSPDEIALFDLLRRASPARTRSAGACTTCTVL